MAELADNYQEWFEVEKVFIVLRKIADYVPVKAIQRLHPYIGPMMRCLRSLKMRKSWRALICSFITRSKQIINSIVDIVLEGDKPF